MSDDQAERAVRARKLYQDMHPERHFFSEGVDGHCYAMLEQFEREAERRVYADMLKRAKRRLEAYTKGERMAKELIWMIDYLESR